MKTLCCISLAWLALAAAPAGADAQTTKSAARLTPQDQAEDSQDLNLTAAVRRSIVGLSNLSVAGQNIKVVSRDQVVTLIGPVKTETEKTAIESAAREAAQGARVDSELVVK